MKANHTLAALAALLLSVAIALTGCADLPEAGVIGGADGPTGIYTGGDEYLIDGEPEGEEPPAPDAEETVPPAGVPEDEAPSDGTGAAVGEDLPYEEEPALDEGGTYNSAGDVSLYLYTYGHLPDNYITKNEARDLGWTGGSVEQVAPGCAIGGDTFGNREGILPEGRYHECDIDTIGESSRGAKRIVYSDDGRIYYTEDHYETFDLLYGEE